MKTFKTGDVVEYIGKSSAWNKGHIHIVHECLYLGDGKFKYSTTRGGWFKASDFKLIHPANRESFRQLDDIIFYEVK